MLLSQKQVENLLKIQGYYNIDDKYGNNMFLDLLIKIEKNGVKIDKKLLPKNYTSNWKDGTYNVKELTEELANGLANRIEWFSKDFWDLFSNSEKNLISHKTVDKKIRKSKVSFLKINKTQDLWKKMLPLFDRQDYVYEEYIKLWQSIVPQNIKENSYKFIDNYDIVDRTDSGYKLRLDLYMRFTNSEEKIAELYKDVRGTNFQLTMEKKLNNPAVELYKVPLMNTYSEIEYRQVYSLDPFYFCHKYHVEKELVLNFLNIFEHLLNMKANELNLSTEVNFNDVEYSSNLCHNRPVVTFKLKINYEPTLKVAVQWFNENLLYMSETLFSENYKRMLTKEEINKTLDYNNMIDLYNFFEKKEIYDKLDNKLHKKNGFQTKHKI